jgi:uncharacterized protein
MTSTPTPEQIEVYAATLRARSAEATWRRRERREQAWTVARQAAQVLRGQFGVAGVWVFGSLVEGDHFTERSESTWRPPASRPYCTLRPWAGC